MAEIFFHPNTMYLSVLRTYYHLKAEIIKNPPYSKIKELQDLGKRVEEIAPLINEPEKRSKLEQIAALVNQQLALNLDLNKEKDFSSLKK